MGFYSMLMFFIWFSFLQTNYAPKVASTHAGEILGRSFRGPKYNIHFHSAHSPFHPDDEQDSIMMTNEKRQKFLCFMPIIDQHRFDKTIFKQNTDNMIAETDNPIKFKTPDELLDVLEDKCLVRQEGWWSYEFCYQKHLRQIHVDDDKVIAQQFLLGTYDHETTAALNNNSTYISSVKDPRSKDASQRYHAHLYTNGTICDLTNQPRETEVRFVCSESNVMISSIKEVSTCKYIMTVQCPLLCKHPMFQEERPIRHTINCNEIPGLDKDARTDDDITEKQIRIVTDIEISP